MNVKNLTLLAVILSSAVIIGTSPLPSMSQSVPSSSNEPTVVDPNSGLAIEKYAGGLEFPSSMAFLGPDDILVLEKNSGQVRRIVNSAVLEEPVLDVSVATKHERGLLGIAVSKDSQNNATFVFLYYTESSRDGDDLDGIDPLGNRLYRYEFVGGKLINGRLLLDLPAKEASHHNGGRIAIGPDENVYLVVGDLQDPGQNTTLNHITTAQNVANSLYPDGTAGILRVTQDGEPVSKILEGRYPLELYYAYGIRNSFGIDFDPVTNNLWDTENGPDFGDEINLVEPGFNSGWRRIQGIEEDPTLLSLLVQFPGLSARDESLVGRIQQFWFDLTGSGGKYSNPEFVWDDTVAPTAIKFLDSNALGERYVNDMFVASYTTGNIFHFELNDNRTGFVLAGDLADGVADDYNEAEQLVFAENLGRITDMALGPDGYLYILTMQGIEGVVYRIVPTVNS